MISVLFTSNEGQPTQSGRDFLPYRGLHYLWQYDPRSQVEGRPYLAAYRLLIALPIAVIALEAEIPMFVTIATLRSSSG